jgi:hypothetical protein
LVSLGFENYSYSQDSIQHQLKLPKDSTTLSLNKASLHNDSLKKDSTKAKKSEGLESPVSYSSTDSIHFKVKSRIINLYGEGEIDYEDLILKSQNVELDMNKREVYARGKKDSVGDYRGRPNFKQGNEVFDSDTLKYSFDSKKGLVYGLVTKQEDGYLHSEKTKILPDKEVNVKNGKFTTCDQEHPHFYVAMTKALVIPNDKIVTGPAYLVIEDVPIPIVVPFGFFPNKKGRANGILMPTFGNDQIRGYYFKDGGVYFGIGEYADVTLKGDIYTLNSWRLTEESNYRKLYKFSGNLAFTYAQLWENEKKLSPTFSFKWNHTQDAKASRYGLFGASVNYQSAGFNKKNAQNMQDFLNPSIGSSITYSKPLFKVANLTISGNHSQNLITDIVSISLPNVAFSASSLTPFKRKKATGKTRWYEDIRISYSYDAQNRLSNYKMDSTFYTKATLDKFQKGMKHSIPVSTSIKFLKYFTISPNFNFTDRWLFEKMSQRWDSSKVIKTKTATTYGGVDTAVTRGLYNVWDYSLGAGINTNIYGMYTFKNKVLRAIRHKMTPSVSYTYTPDFGSNQYHYWTSYRDVHGNNQYYSPYANPIYGTPGKGKQSSIGFRLSNSLEMKVRNRKDTVTYTKKISLIDDFTISSSYNFAADSMKWSLVSLTGNTNLLKRLSLQYSANFDPYKVGKNKYGEIQRYNNLMFDTYGRLWRIDNSQFTVSTSLQLGPSKDNAKAPSAPSKKTAYFSDFSIPWNMSITYSWSLPRKYYYNQYNKIDSVGSKIVQTLGVTGVISFTKHWKVNYATGWDFMANKISYTKFDFYRDLHCWDMSFLWIPFGQMQRYEFSVKVRAGMLKDLKVDKKKTYGNVYY